MVIEGKSVSGPSAKLKSHMIGARSRGCNTGPPRQLSVRDYQQFIVELSRRIEARGVDIGCDHAPVRDSGGGSCGIGAD